MADEEHLAILEQGVEAWNKWRDDNSIIRPYLMHADLREVNLKGANLSQAALLHADLTSADLSSADLTTADLFDAKLINANLSRADLRGASLECAYFSSANLQDADFAHSRAYLTVFADTDLSVAKGLDSVRHNGPTAISTSTLYKSGGNIPEAFLRGCGLRDWEVENAKLYRHDLSAGQATDILYRVVGLCTNPAIQFNSCFISYSSTDQDFSERLFANLQDKGVRCWFAPEHMKIGDKIRTRIDEAIRLQDKLLLVLSETSIESQWVEQEVETALEKERDQKRTVLCPIMVDKSVMSTDAGWARLIKNTRHIGDFSQCEDEAAYQKAVDRLLRDLRAEEAT